MKLEIEVVKTLATWSISRLSISISGYASEFLWSKVVIDEKFLEVKDCHLTDFCRSLNVDSSRLARISRSQNVDQAKSGAPKSTLDL